MRRPSGLLLVLLLVAVVGLTGCGAASPEGAASVEGLGEPLGETDVPDLVIPVGLYRDPQGSSVLVNVCEQAGEDAADAARASLVEDRRGRCVPADRRRAAAGGDAAGDPGRPGVGAVLVAKDLHVCGEDERAADAPRFPVDQVSTSAELVGASSLKVVVSVDPDSPIEPEPGAYCGAIVVERDGTDPLVLDFAVGLADREGRAMVWAFLWLTVGAFLGVMLRFFNDPIGKLVPLYRRYRSTARWVRSLVAGYDGTPLPATVKTLQARLLDVEDSFRLLDPVAADQSAWASSTTARAAITADPAAADRRYAALPVGEQDRRTGSRARAACACCSGRSTSTGWSRSSPWCSASSSSGSGPGYVQNDLFAGSLEDWVGLVTFGLAAQVTATTVAESLGRLLPTARQAARLTRRPTGRPGGGARGLGWEDGDVPDKPPERPRPVTWAAAVIIGGSVLVLITSWQVVAGIGSLDTREGVEEFLAEPPGSGLGLDVPAALDALRLTATVAAACAVAAAILGGYVLQRSRSARIGLSTLAPPIFVAGAITGGLVSAAVVAAVVTLWLTPAREWFAGREPAARRPGPAAPGATPAPVAGPPPTAPAAGSAPTGTTSLAGPSSRPSRPAAVLVAAIVTWSLTGLVLLVGLLSVAALWAAPDAIEAALREQDPGALEQGVSFREVQVGTTVLFALVVAWCLGVAVAAGFVLRGSRPARVVLLVSAVSAGGLALVATLASAVAVVPMVGCLVVAGLLLRPEVRAWP